MCLQLSACPKQAKTHRPMRKQRSNSKPAVKVFGLPRYLFGFLVVVVVVVLVMTLAVMFGRKKASPPRSTVLVPLYVYPDPGAWDPLFTASVSPLPHKQQLTINSISQHPTLHFTIVINPGSGPGPNPLPDKNYTQELPKLNSYNNVRTVGYVSTQWAKRDMQSVLKDIRTYSGWASNSTFLGLGLQGIFLDETPAIYNADSVKYLDTVASAIRFQPGFGNSPLVSYTVLHLLSVLGNIEPKHRLSSRDPCREHPVSFRFDSTCLISDGPR